MAGAGYNIPVSLSDATGFTTPFAFEAPNIILFPGAQLGSYQGGIRQNTEQPVTATSSAAEGNAASHASGTGVNSSGTETGGGGGAFTWSPINIAVIAFIALLAYKTLKGS